MPPAASPCPASPPPLHPPPPVHPQVIVPDRLEPRIELAFALDENACQLVVTGIARHDRQPVLQRGGRDDQVGLREGMPGLAALLARQVASSSRAIVDRSITESPRPLAATAPAESSARASWQS